MCSVMTVCLERLQLILLLCSFKRIFSYLFVYPMYEASHLLLSFIDYILRGKFVEFILMFNKGIQSIQTSKSNYKDKL